MVVHTLASTLGSVLLLAACAATPAPVTAGGPRGPRATDHVDEARRHDELARERTRYPDTRSAGPTDAPVGVWYRTWDTTDHAHLADIHRSKAAELQAEFDAACAGLSGAEISISPLARRGLGGWNTTTGAIVYLTPVTGGPDQLLREMACHRAWMMLGPTDMEDCPLDLPGLVLDARGDADGITVSLSVRDPDLVAELQRRAMKDLESARSGHPGVRLPHD